jgi:hypothetical protein
MGAALAVEIAKAAEEAVGRQLGDPLSAGWARAKVLVDRFGRGFVELAQAVGIQRLVGRVKGLYCVHQIGLPLRVRVAVE